MNNSFLKHFPIIEPLKFDDPYDEKRLSKGQAFRLIRPSIYKESFERGRIYNTVWNKLCDCYDICPMLDWSSTQLDNSYLSIKKRQYYFEKYGPYDLVVFIPVCGIFFCSRKESYTNSDDGYYDPGLIFNNTVYLYKTPFDKSRTDLEYSDYFKTDNQLLFTSVVIDPRLLTLSYSLGLTDIQFILAATGYIHPYDSQWYRRYDYGYQEITSIFRLLQLLTTSKKHSIEYNFED